MSSPGMVPPRPDVERRRGHNATDQAQIDSKRDRELRLREQDRADLAEVLSTPSGRRWIYRLIFHRCQLCTAVALPHDELLGLNGARSVGADVMAQIQEQLPAAWLQMLRERIEDKSV